MRIELAREILSLILCLLRSFFNYELNDVCIDYFFTDLCSLFGRLRWYIKVQKDFQVHFSLVIEYLETFLFCKTTPPKLINGLIKRDRVSFYQGQGYLGNMEYMCLPGYDLVGNKIVTCGQGFWTTMPQCIRMWTADVYFVRLDEESFYYLAKKRCSPIETYPVNTMIESDNITFFQNDPQQIVVGSMITLRCIDNYEFDPTLDGSLRILCQNDGSWTAMPTCRCK